MPDDWDVPPHRRDTTSRQDRLEAGLTLVAKGVAAAWVMLERVRHRLLDTETENKRLRADVDELRVKLGALEKAVPAAAEEARKRAVGEMCLMQAYRDR